MKWLLPRNKRLGSARRVEQTTRLENNWINSKFDESTGQVYTETTVAAPRYRVTDKHWARKSAVLAERDDGHRGARSLQDVAIELILQNLPDITEEGLRFLPEPIVERIWREVQRRCLISLNTWLIFSRCLSNSRSRYRDLMRYSQVLCIPTSPLEVYITPLTHSFDFLTTLSLTTAFQLPDLLKIANIRNLGFLEIINNWRETADPAGTISDRVIRSWSLAAHDEGAFRALRILRLWYLEELTETSLSFLNEFPSLTVYDVRGCRFNHEAVNIAARYGWQVYQDETIPGHTTLHDSLARERGTMLKALSTTEEESCSSSTLKETCNEEGKDTTQRESKKRRESSSRKFSRRRLVQEKGHANGIPRSWCSEVISNFARAGDVLGNGDLVEAGLLSSDYLSLGAEALDLVPVVSLCLGDSRRLIDIPSRGMCFTRTRRPQPDCGTRMEPRSNSTALNAKGKPARGSLMRSKKRKLDDVLGSFL